MAHKIVILKEQTHIFPAVEGKFVSNVVNVRKFSQGEKTGYG
jgi:hypothetical protein